MARGLQTLVLAREGILAPELSSIEEYLGRNTDTYYAVLAEVGGGAWQPRRSARPWVRFALTAHYRQVEALRRRAIEAERRWDALEREVRRRRLLERSVGALWDAALGFRVRNSTYREFAEVGIAVAGRDLKALADAGLLVARGQARGQALRGFREVEGDRGVDPPRFGTHSRPVRRGPAPAGVYAHGRARRGLRVRPRWAPLLTVIPAAVDGKRGHA